MATVTAMPGRHAAHALALVAMLIVLSTRLASSDKPASSQVTKSWPSFGGNYLNHRSAVVKEPVATLLTPKFKIDTNGSDVSCTPVVAEGYAYFGDWAGLLYKIDADSGKVVWRKNVTELVWPGGVGATNKLLMRTSPATVFGSGSSVKTIVVGTQGVVPPGNPAGTQAFLLSVNVATGKALWQYDASQGHPFAIITASPTVYGGNVYCSTSSNEELAAGIGLPCCNFRGNVFSVRLSDGAHRWTFFTAPQNGGSYDSWSGNGVWGSAPAIDEARNLVYVATGNSYGAPANVTQCLEDNTGNPQAQAQCVDVEGNWFDSVLALSTSTGALAWGRRVSYFDVWTAACLPFLPIIEIPPFGNPCPSEESPDYDFGQAPLYFPNTKCGNKTRDILVAAQKSGFAYGFDASDPDAGGYAPWRLSWSTFTGAGSIVGGSQWGSASDGYRTVFLQNSNRAGVNVTLTRPALDSPKWTTGGFATAVDICTGEVKWQAAAPIQPAAQSSLVGPPTYVRSLQGTGPAYVFYPSVSTDGRIVVLHAENGEVHTTFAAGPGSIVSGASVADGVMYTGVGYLRTGVPTPQYGMAAFDLSGESDN